MLAIQILIVVIILFGASVIVSTKNVVHAAYALALTLIGIAGLYVLMNAELLAVVQILIYAGGVVILLSFGIMLTNRIGGQKVISESRNRFLGAISSLLIFAGFSTLIYQLDLHSLEVIAISDAITQIGVSMLTENLVAFELIAFILLVALVGAAYLAKVSSDE